MTTGQRIKARRKEIGLSAEYVAGKLGVSPATIYRYESGDIEKVPGDRLEPIAKILQTTPQTLMGWEDFYPKQSNVIQLPSNVIPLPPMQKVPLVGQIACGTPILAEQNITDYIDLPSHIRADYALTCKGDSMINIGIQSGDIVYIRQQEEVENGQVAAVMIGDDEATLKRFYREDNVIQLIAENAAIPPKVYLGEAINQIRVVGLAVAFIHIIE